MPKVPKHSGQSAQNSEGMLYTKSGMVPIPELITPITLCRAIEMDLTWFWTKYRKGDVTGFILICKQVFLSRPHVNIRYTTKKGGEKWRSWVAAGRPITGITDRNAVNAA